MRRVALGSALACVLALGAEAHAQTGTPFDLIPSTDEPVLSFESPVGPIEYFAGRGLHFGRTGLTIGGFTTLEVDREQGGPGVLELDSVNFLVLYQPLDALRFFAEIEVGGLFSYDIDAGDVSSDPQVEFRRLYGDLSRSDALNLRVGKFQTPVGRWNLVPAEPFVWTAIEPVLVERAFDEHQTGGALFGSLYPGTNTLRYWVYGQFVDPLDADPDPAPADRSVGTRLEYGGALEDWSLGTSFLASERNGAWNFLGGLDALWQVGPLELTTEFVVAGGDVAERDLWGVYVQGVYELGSLSRHLRRFYLVGRFEHFDPSGSSEDANLFDLGIAWIPAPYLNIKAGYRFSDRQTEDVHRGLTASLSLLF